MTHPAVEELLERQQSAARRLDALLAELSAVGRDHGRDVPMRRLHLQYLELYHVALRYAESLGDIVDFINRSFRED